jgi:hypothetical protein
MNGTTAFTPGSCAAVACFERQSGMTPSTPVMVACEVTVSMRLRSSRSKPLSTDSTTMSTATPSASPSTDMEATKETKPLRCAERR